MSNQQILAKINQLKARVKVIVGDIQGLRRKLERAEISLGEFKANKSMLEDELRGILQQISEVKESAKMFPTIRAREPVQIERPPEEEKPVELEKPVLPETPLEIEEEPPELELVGIPEDDTAEVIDREIRLAEEAKELMYYFQTEFEETTTKANVYISITVEDHFIIGVDYTDYPQRPKLKVPMGILELFDNSDEEFHKDLPSYLDWDPNNPSRIFELITEIETVLINIYSADIDSILKKSQEFAEEAQDSIEKMVEDAENKVLFKDYGRAVENYYQIIELAYDVQDYDAAKKYTDRLNEILKMGTKEKKDKKGKKKKK